jgi:hypothetical protein
LLISHTYCTGHYDEESTPITIDTDLLGVEDILSPAEDIANKKNLQKDPIKIEKDLTVGVEDSLSPTKDTFNKFDTEAIVKAISDQLQAEVDAKSHDPNEQQA